MGTRWGLVALATGAGILAGAQVGKVPPALPAVRGELGLGLVGAGWVVSVFNLVAALGGLAVGAVADRLGPRRALALGLAALAAGAAGGAAAAGGGALIAWRALAGVGLVAVAVAAPRLIAAVTRAQHLRLALGIWSIYMPAGMAAAMVAAPPVLAAAGWRGLWAADAAVVLLFLGVFLVATVGLGGAGGGGAGRPGPMLRRLPLWGLAAVFACYTVPFFAVMAWLPTFLAEAGIGAAAAARASAAVVAGNMLGNLGGAWWLHRGVAAWRLQGIAFAVMAATGLALFSGGFDAPVRIGLAFAFSAFGGLLPAATLTAAGVMAGPRQVSTANGLVVQGANVGSLIGPPLIAAVVEAAGWAAGRWVVLAACALGLAVVEALRRAGPQGAAG